MNIAQFFNLGAEHPWLFFALLSVCGVAFVNGRSDAPNSIATAISTRSIDPRWAIALAAVGNLGGAILIGYLSIATSVFGSVGNTLASIADLSGANIDQTLMLITFAMVSVILYSTASTFLGFPCSESNEIVGGITGAAIAFAAGSNLNWFSLVHWDAFGTTFLGMAVSLLVGFALGFALVKLIELICQRMTRNRTTRFFDIGQIVSSGLMSLMHGVQDGMKFMGIMLMILVGATGVSAKNLQGSEWLIYLVAFFMMLGTSLGGAKIIKTMGSGMAKLEKYQGFATDLAAFLGLSMASVLGWPVSTGQVKLASIMGAGATKGIRHVKWKAAGRVLITWVTTVPICLLLTFIFSIIAMQFM